MVADAVGSVGVLIGAAIIAATSWYWVDSLIAIGIGCSSCPRLQARPRRAPDPGRVRPRPHDVDSVTATWQIDGVVEAHDLHVWTITSGMDAMSVHLQVHPQAPTCMPFSTGPATLLRDRHKISHATVQVEPADHAGCNLSVVTHKLVSPIPSPLRGVVDPAGDNRTRLPGGAADPLGRLLGRAHRAGA